MVLIPSGSSLPTELYDPKAFITHAAWLDQACAHCPIFPTAASRRSLGRVSVPVWLIILSDQLRVFALVALSSRSPPVAAVAAATPRRTTISRTAGTTTRWWR